MYIGKRCISIILLICHVFMFTGCYTTLSEYRGGNNFPFSTYSDALLYKNENIKVDDFEKVIIETHRETKKELVKSEREFRPVATAMAIGLPVLGLLTIILSFVFNPPTQEANQ